MSSRQFNTDEGIVLRKIQLKGAHQSVTLLTPQHGKISVIAYGTKNLKSKKLSHLETGNVLQLSWRVKNDYATLHETELKYAHSKIKEDQERLDTLYVILMIVNKIALENTDMSFIYDKTLALLRKLHKEGAVRQDVEMFLKEVLQNEGFLSQEQVNSDAFDVVRFTEGLVNQRIGV